MSGTDFLLDTNIVWYLLKGDDRLESLLDGAGTIYLSVVTKVELLSTPGLDGKGELLVRQFPGDSRIVEFTPDVQDLTVLIRKKHKLKFADATIAATAAYLNVQLVTADKKFARLSNDLQVLLFEP